MTKGKACVLIQENAGSGMGLPYTKNLLKNNTLIASIHMADIFRGKAGVQTAVYLFDVGKPHDTNKYVKFIDFSDDGYTRQNRKKSSQEVNLRDTGNATERYQEVADLVLDRKKLKDCTYITDEIFIEDKITDKGDDWTFNQHKKIDLTPTEDDFKKVVADYLAWKVGKICDLFTWSNGNTDIKKEDINGKGYLVVSSGVENQGIIGRTDMSARVLPKNTVTIDMFGNVYYRNFEYKEVTHARVFTLIPNNFTLNTQTGLYIVTSLKWLSKVYSYDNMCSYEKIKNVEIKLPVKESSNTEHQYTVSDIDWNYMQEYIRKLELERIGELELYLKVTGLSSYELTDEEKIVMAKNGKSGG